MRESALKISPGVEFLYGTVRAWSEEDFMVETPVGVLKARLAAGCLLRPSSGDRVLLAHFPGESYIIAVLVQREPQASLRLGKALLRGDEKGLSVETPHLEFLVAGETHLKTVALETQVLRGRFFVREAFFGAQRLFSHIRRYHLITETFHLFSRKFVQRLKDCYAWIEGLEQRKIGRLRYLVKESLFFRARRSTLRAEKKVSINAEKINLG